MDLHRKGRDNMKIRKIVILLLVVIIIFVSCVVENNHLTISHYEYCSQKVEMGFDGFKLVQLSDIHNARFGKDSGRLFKAVREQAPDIIVVTGDVVDIHTRDILVPIQLMSGLTEIAPVYYVTGNHEYDLDMDKLEKFITGISSAGITVLNNMAVEISKNGESFYLVGLDDQSLDDTTLEDITRKLDQSRLKILLAHEPQQIKNYASFGMDLVLSGHTHGGQIRLPFTGALFAPGQGLFPEYSDGRYEEGESTMIVSRGLGNSGVPIRAFCSPEIVTMVLKMQP